MKTTSFFCYQLNIIYNYDVEVVTSSTFYSKELKKYKVCDSSFEVIKWKKYQTEIKNKKLLH